MAEEPKRRRLEKTTISCPLVYGSISYWMGKKADEYATHKWTLFVRGPNDEDLSVFISKIIFSLHPSFANPLREITNPPYEVTEMGWGEFEAGIRIFFKDPDEKYVDILHPIKLYPGGGQQLTVKKPVMHEFYDEIVFTNPHPDFFANLMLYTPPPPDTRPVTHLTEYYTVFDEESDLQHLLSIQHHLSAQIDAAKARLLQLDGELAYFNPGSKPSPAQPQQPGNSSSSGGATAPGGSGSSTSSTGSSSSASATATGSATGQSGGRRKSQQGERSSAGQSQGQGQQQAPPSSNSSSKLLGNNLLTSAVGPASAELISGGTRGGSVGGGQGKVN